MKKLIIILPLILIIFTGCTKNNIECSKTIDEVSGSSTLNTIKVKYKKDKPQTYNEYYKITAVSTSSFETAKIVSRLQADSYKKSGFNIEYKINKDNILITRSLDKTSKEDLFLSTGLKETSSGYLTQKKYKDHLTRNGYSCK
ncbi:MAG: hypothetical protein RSB41_01515 [Bacilli bacterium]